MPTHARRRVHRLTTLDPDEQSELAVKLRYGIGLEQLVGENDAALIRWEMAPIGMRRERPPERALAYPPRSDEQVRRRAAALGICAGRRGHWIGR